MLLLCKTYPDFSQKYYYRICMSGITDMGELRRIFPVPINFFLKNINIFKNYHWIEYELKEKGDYRKESFKVKFNTIKPIGTASSSEIFKYVSERINSLEKLSELRDNENISLGFIKPKITKTIIELSRERNEKKRRLDSQLTLFNGRLGDLYVPYLVRFDFFCIDSPLCSGHSIMCEDINFWHFFKEEMEKKNSFESIENNFKEKFLTWIQNDKGLIFMMGTHFQYKTWLIISILSPFIFKNND